MAICLIDKLDYIEDALTVLKLDVMEQVGQKVAKGYFYGNTQRQTQ